MGAKWHLWMTFQAVVYGPISPMILNGKLVNDDLTIGVSSSLYRGFNCTNAGHRGTASPDAAIAGAAFRQQMRGTDGIRPLSCRDFGAFSVKK